MKTPELLSPAGTLKSMRYAFAYGADAVYGGMPRYSLRVRNNDFLEDNLLTGIDEAHAQGKRFFVAANIMPHSAKLKTFIDHISPIVEMRPDALIMSDPGLIMLVRENWPELSVHLSVQANTMNSASVKFWQSIGLSRVILSRELSLDEVEEVRQECPEMEIEVFVHGALCVAYSGRCLLSGYFNHRDANQGACTNSCRWEYSVSEQPLVNVDAIQRHPKADQTCYLDEQGRQSEYMPIEEDEHGTYIMNSKDLRAVEHIQRLVEIGVDSLKIEGRTKSHYYTAHTTQVYRRAIDDAVAGYEFDPELMGELEMLSNRGYTDGFFQRHEPHELQNYRQGASTAAKSQFVAEITAFNADAGWVQLDVKNRFGVGDRLTLLSPEGNQAFILESMQDLQGNPMEIAPGSGWQVRVQIPGVSSSLGLIIRLFNEC
ncbi:MAG: tRNA 5-hydroxyuridine modification protein YegQ [bacterium]|nr:tRNA 5-hydroxyuridine modification protein YegQ [bacterium]